MGDDEEGVGLGRGNGARLGEERFDPIQFSPGGRTGEAQFKAPGETGAGRGSGGVVAGARAVRSGVLAERGGGGTGAGRGSGGAASGARAGNANCSTLLQFVYALRHSTKQLAPKFDRNDKYTNFSSLFKLTHL